MMENNPTPSPESVPEAAPITVPVPAESAVTPPPAPPVPPLCERPNAPLLHKGFQNLFRLGIANIVINLLNNTFKLGDKIPSLGVVLSVVSLAVSILTLIVLWKLSAAVPRFRSVVYLNLFPLVLFPFAALVGLSNLQERIDESNSTGLLVFLVILLGLLLVLSALSAYHQLTACAEAFDGADDEMAAKWRKLCTWQVVVIGCFGAFLTLLLLLGLSSASFFYFYNGSLIVLLLLILAIAIALGVVEIIELVYLNRSAKLYE
ncbi:MAG TPA: hypothetical protein DC027_07935 [Oscillibacter sp.]|nr:hypothetical protein [Oscillibacter sp.]